MVEAIAVGNVNFVDKMKSELGPKRRIAIWTVQAVQTVQSLASAPFKP